MPKAKLMGAPEVTYDIVVIGGGASGLSAAIAGARAGTRVLVLERDVACGLSILATGNGRCNLSNAKLDVEHYAHSSAARTVMGQAPEKTIDAFFSSLGLLTCNIEDRLYPVTRRAESVRCVLLRGACQAGAELVYGAELVEAKHSADKWRLSVLVPKLPISFKGDARHSRKELAVAPRIKQDICARHVVVAAGKNVSPLCHLFGLPYREQTPVLCPIAAAPLAAKDGAAPLLSSMDGLRVQAKLTLLHEDEPLHSEVGELLFRSYGISGIAAFNVSRRCLPGDTVEIDLFPQMSLDELIEMLCQREQSIGAFSLNNPAWFDGLLGCSLSAFVVQLFRGTVAFTSSDDKEAKEAKGEKEDTLACIAALLKHLPLRVEGLVEQQQAQAQRGGIPLDVLDLSTLAVSPALAQGLYVCGEALDQDADCGGFNLAWAWLSGLRAGKAAAGV